MWPFKCEQFKIRLWHYSHAVSAKRHQASESYVRCLKVLCCYTFDHISCMRLSHKYRKWLLLPLNIQGAIKKFRSFEATLLYIYLEFRKCIYFDKIDLLVHFPMGTSMYYVIKILGFLAPPPSPLCDYFQY